jgi:hypothetical protein
VDVLLQIAGGAIVLVVLADVFLTVLFPGSGHGPLRRPVSKLVSHAFRAVARLAGPRRAHEVLSYRGPVLVVVSIAVWPVVLTCGWAMIYLPVLGHAVTASSGTVPHDWATAFYYSAFAVTTLGTGDVVPQTGLYRFLLVTEAAIGFAVLTMVITYFLSVYNAITERKTVGGALHHRTLGTGDSVTFITALADGDDISSVVSQLSSTGEFVQNVCETHRAYPVLHYFHFRDVRYSLPRILAVVLEAAALLGSALDPESYPRLQRSPALALVDGAARDLLAELVGDRFGGPVPDGARELWNKRFDDAVHRLADAGLAVRDDDEARQTYARWREHWDSALQYLAEQELYDWREISPGNE